MANIQPPMPQHISLEGGRPWTRKPSGVQGYSSDDGNYDILCGNGYVILVSFIHEPLKTGEEFWRKRFKTVKDAVEYAERI
jgi:hypothetical protein